MSSAGDDSFRSIRVFVSSTFQDMQAEREELVKRIFPQLRKMCEARGVAWSEVDLRWGVTDEQKAEGAVLPVCLAEIDRSRPFFIGVLGQRYGWIPEEMPAGLVEQLPWLAHLRGKSVTELEILHGVLNEPGSEGHAFFYTLDPASVQGWTADEQLDDLKRRVRGAGLPTWQYADPVALGARVLADFTALIERLYPLHDVPDSHQRDDEAHRAFGVAQIAGHIERRQLTTVLNEHATSNHPPLVVSGDVGAGAGVVATTWLAAWRRAHPDDVIIEHHVGATQDSADWREMAERITANLTREHGFVTQLADPPAGTTSDPAGHRSALFAALTRAGSSPRRTVLMINGADLLTDVDGAPDLTWLPASGSASMRIVVTTSGGRPLAEVRRRGWPVLEVPPLDDAERRATIATFLGRYSKGLDEVHIARLVDAPATANPLFLRTVLDELRQHGDHFTLGEVIEHYLGAATLDDLLGLVLTRYEVDFNRDRPGLVQESMRALFAARHGLTEPELLDHLGNLGDGEPLPSAVWSPLVLAAEAGLVTQSGRLVLATQSHRRAVQQRYLADDDALRSAHAALARTFSRYDLGPRVVEELPWHQLGAGQLDALAATLSDLDFTALAYNHAHTDVRRLWRRLEESGRRVVDGYRSIVDDPDTNPELAWEVARLVTDAGYPTEAARLNRYLVDRYRRGTDEVAARRLPAALVNYGAALFSQGELGAAEPILQEAINLGRARNDFGVLTAALGNLALCRRDRGDPHGALALFAEEEAICRRLDDSGGLQASLGNRAQLLRQLGDYDAALTLLTEQEQLCRSIGDSVGIARALAGQGAVLGDLGDPAHALAKLTAYREISDELGDLRAVAEASIGEANTLRQLGRRDEAAERARQAEELIRRLSDEPLLARILDAQARAAVDEGRWADGQRLASEAVLTARSAGASSALVLALGMLGTAQRELGNVGGARATHLEEEALAAHLNDTAALATARVNLGAVEIVSGDLNAALARYDQAEPVLRSLGLHMTLVPLYNNRWQVHANLGNIPAAIDDLIAGGRSAAACGALPQSRDMLTKAVEYLYGTGRPNETERIWANLEEVCAALGDESGLQRAIGERAMLVLGRGDVGAAAPLFDQQEEICRRIGDQIGLAACVGNRAILLRQTGDLAGALRCVDTQLEIATASGNGQGYLFATANRGEILVAMGRTADGLTALSAARTMAANNGLTPMVQQLDQMIAAARAGQQ